MKKLNVKPILVNEKEMRFMSVYEYDCGRYFVVENKIDEDTTTRLTSKDGLGPNGEINPDNVMTFEFPGGIVDERYLKDVKLNIEELEYWFLYFSRKRPAL